MSTLIKIVLLALGVLLAITSIADALPETYEFTPVKHEVKQVVVYAKQESYLKPNCEALRPIFGLYDWDVEMVMKISNFESGCNPKNHNYKDKHSTCMGSWNVLNVGCIHYKTGEDIDDVELNVKKAYSIYMSKKRSFTDWTTCDKVIGCK